MTPMFSRSPWLRRLAIALVGALALGWLPGQFYGGTGLARLMKLRAELATLRQGNADIRRRNARLRAELALDDDDELAAVERIARDELGLVKPGEIVYKLEESHAASSPVAAPEPGDGGPARSASAAGPGR